jgi:thioredoxin-dependent peroxiredoxin
MPNRLNVGLSVRHLALLVSLEWLSSPAVQAADELPKPPAVGDAAPGFELKTVTGEAVKLEGLTQDSPVVLIVLRGYPGYQCPVCTKQAGRFLAAASKLKDAGAQVVMIYPGPSDELAERANEFKKDWTLPEHFHLLLDPDYAFTNAWHLRWDEPMETAYPSTFVIGKDGKVGFAKVSKTHGGRASVEEVLSALKE